MVRAAYRLQASLALLLAVLGPPNAAAANEASFHVEVPAGEWTALRLRSLPARTTVTVEVVASGRVRVALLDEPDFALYPAPRRQLFGGVAERSLSISVRTAADGNHYVVLDNSAAGEPRTVDVTVAARRDGRDGRDEPDGRDEQDGAETNGGTASTRAEPSSLGERIQGTELQLRRFQAQLAEVFAFEPFPMRVRRCGGIRFQRGLFVENGGIVVCTEYGPSVRRRVADRTKAAEVMLFGLFHELGHLLLQQWEVPFYDDEDIADEFATAALMLLGQRDRLGATVEYFGKSASPDEVLAQARQDDPHPLAIQRARNLRRWANDPDFLRKWQRVFLPHMTSEALRALADQRPAWSEPERVARELAARDGLSEANGVTGSGRAP